METKSVEQVVDKKYDVIVIGSGIGGLTAAAYLAQRKKKVLVVEQMPYPGGVICSFRHKGFYFDGGPTSVSFMKILSKIYGDLGIWEKIKWNRVHHQIITPEMNLDVENEEEFIKGISNNYPESTDEVVSLLKHLNKIVKRINPIYDHHPSYKEGAAKTLAQMLMPIYLFPTVYTASKYTKITKKKTIEKYLKTEGRVKDIFKASGYENIATVDMSFMWDTFLGNLYYPDGGMVSMIHPLVEYLNEHDADILYSNPVKKFIVNNDEHTINGIVLSNDTVLKADYYISNADYKRTFKTLIGEANLNKNLLDKLNKAQTTEPIVNLFLGLNVDPKDLPVIHRPNTMIFFDDAKPHFEVDYNDPDYFKKINISIYIPDFNDPTLNKPGKTSMIVAAVGNYHFRNDWETVDGRREEAYRALKKEVEETLISRVEQIIPNIRDLIEYSTLATPFTYERYTGVWEGASCGWAGEKSKAFFKNDVEAAMGALTPYKNLFMAGQWTYFNGGVPAALSSGRGTGVDVAHIIEKVNKKKKKGK